MSTALLFPGQGSQFTGMCRDHFESVESVKRRFGQADEILGYKISEIMFEGPDDLLRQTEHTQPAIFLHSISLFESLDIRPDMTAGHSLGEFSAIVASGAISFEDGIRLVSLRGSLMQKAGEENPGAMAAIIGMDDEIVENICEEATAAAFKPVVPANYNCPGQLVISGDEKAVDTAIELAKGRGCRLAKKLPVSGAFHSPLMESAYEDLKKELEGTVFKKPLCPVYSNYTAEATDDEEEIRDHVLKQLLHPVRWTQTLLNMQQNGADSFVEVGPGKVLQGLVKRTLSDVQISGYQ